MLTQDNTTMPDEPKAESSAGMDIQQTAGHLGEKHLSAVIVLYLVQAAFTAPIT